MKKTYSKPRLEKEQFMPQEYCTPCETTITLSSTARAYYDLNDDGNFDSGENRLPLDKNYRFISVYYLQRADNNGAVNQGHFYDSTDNPNVPANHSYTNSGLFGNKPFYRFYSPNLSVMIKNGQTYLNVS